LLKAGKRHAMKCRRGKTGWCSRFFWDKSDKYDKEARKPAAGLQRVSFWSSTDWFMQ